jgi:hypothetical protein
MAVGPTEVNCGRNPTIVFRCASEGALEAAGLNPNNLPTLPRHVYGGSC